MKKNIFASLLLIFLVVNLSADLLPLNKQIPVNDDYNFIDTGRTSTTFYDKLDFLELTGDSDKPEIIISQFRDASQNRKPMIGIIEDVGEREWQSLRSSPGNIWSECDVTFKFPDSTNSPGEAFALGDFDGDGNLDLAIGDPNAAHTADFDSLERQGSCYTKTTSTGYVNTGAVYIIHKISAWFLSSPTTYFYDIDSTDNDQTTIFGNQRGSRFGSTLRAGFFNNDITYSELFIGAPREYSWDGVYINDMSDSTKLDSFAVLHYDSTKGNYPAQFSEYDTLVQYNHPHLVKTFIHGLTLAGQTRYTICDGEGDHDEVQTFGGAIYTIYGGLNFYKEAPKYEMRLAGDSLRVARLEGGYNIKSIMDEVEATLEIEYVHLGEHFTLGDFNSDGLEDLFYANPAYHVGLEFRHVHNKKDWVADYVYVIGSSSSDDILSDSTFSFSKVTLKNYTVYHPSIKTSADTSGCEPCGYNNKISINGEYLAPMFERLYQDSLDVESLTKRRPMFSESEGNDSTRMGEPNYLRIDRYSQPKWSFRAKNNIAFSTVPIPSWAGQISFMEGGYFGESILEVPDSLMEKMVWVDSLSVKADSLRLAMYAIDSTVVINDTLRMPHGEISNPTYSDSLKQHYANVVSTQDSMGYHRNNYDVMIGFEGIDPAGNLGIYNILQRGTGDFIARDFTHFFNGGSQGYNIGDLNGDHLDDILWINKAIEGVDFEDSTKYFRVLYGKDSYEETRAIGHIEYDQHVFSAFRTNSYTGKDRIQRTSSVGRTIDTGDGIHGLYTDHLEYMGSMWSEQDEANIRLAHDTLDMGEFQLQHRLNSDSPFVPYEFAIYNVGSDTLNISSITMGDVKRALSLVDGIETGKELWKDGSLVLNELSTIDFPLALEPQSYKILHLDILEDSLTHGLFYTTLTFNSDDCSRASITVPVKVYLEAADLNLSNNIDSQMFSVQVPKQIVKTELVYSDEDSVEQYVYHIEYADYTDNQYSIPISNNGNIPLAIDHIDLSLELDTLSMNYSKIEPDELDQYFEFWLRDSTDIDTIRNYPLSLTNYDTTDSAMQKLQFSFRGEVYAPELPPFGGHGSIDFFFTPIDFVNLKGSFDIYCNDPGFDPDFVSGIPSMEDPALFTMDSLEGKAPALSLDPSEHIFNMLATGTQYYAGVDSSSFLTMDFNLGRVRMVNADSADVTLYYPIGNKVRSFYFENFGNDSLHLLTDYLAYHPYIQYYHAPSDSDWYESGEMSDLTLSPGGFNSISINFIPGDFGDFSTTYQIDGDTSYNCDPHVSLPEGNIFQERSFFANVKGTGYRPDILNIDYEHHLGVIDLNVSQYFSNGGLIQNLGNLNLELDLNSYDSRLFPMETQYTPGAGNTGAWTEMNEDVVYPQEDLFWQSDLFTDDLYWSSWTKEKMVEVVVPLDNNDPWTEDNPQYVRFLASVNPEDPPVATDTLSEGQFDPYMGQLQVVSAIPKAYYDSTSFADRQTMLFGYQDINDISVRTLEFNFSNNFLKPLFLDLLHSPTDFKVNYRLDMDSAYDSLETELVCQPGQTLYLQFTSDPNISNPDTTLFDSLVFTHSDRGSRDMLIPARDSVYVWERQWSGNLLPERDLGKIRVDWLDTLHWTPIDTQVVYLNAGFTSAHTNRIETIDHIALAHGQVSSTQFADDIGRIVETHVFDGRTDVISGTSFDDYGRIQRNLMPMRRETNTVDFLGLELEDSIENFYSYFDDYGIDAQLAYALVENEKSPLGRPKFSITPGGEATADSALTTLISYNVDSQDRFAFLTSTLLPSGVTLEEHSNLGGQKTKTRTWEGTNSSTTEFYYDDLGNMNKSVPPLNSGEHPDSLASKYFYNSLGQLVKKIIPDAEGAFNYAYDVLGNMRFYSDPNSCENEQFYYYNYDAHGRVVEFGFADGIDLPKNTSSKHTGGTPLILYTYDRPYYEAANTHGRLTHIRYNLRFQAGGNDLLGCDQNWFSYDEDGNVAWMRTDLYEVNGTATIGREQFKVANTWLMNGAKHETRYYICDDDSEDLIYYTQNKYDSFGRLEKTLGGQNQYLATVFSNYRYWFDGKLAYQGYMARSQPSSEEDSLVWNHDAVWQEKEYSYDYLGRLSGINKANLEKTAAQGAARQAFASKYVYDLSGNIKFLYEKNWDVTDTSGQSADKLMMYYVYDYLNRLKEAEVEMNYETEYAYLKYQYDVRGNLKDIRRDFTQASNEHLVMDYVDNTNRLEDVTIGNTAYTQSYDANGNLVQDMLLTPSINTNVNNVVYNHLNLPVGVDIDHDIDDYGNLAFAYSPDGQRLSKSWTSESGLDDGEEFYFLDETGKKVGVFTKDSSGYLETKHLNLYSAGSVVGRYNPTAAESGLADSITMYITDHLGSVRFAVVDTFVNNFDQDSVPSYSAPFVANYLPFGGYLPVAVESSTQDEEFTGKQLDDQFGLNWHYFGARYYRSRLGSWNAVDPLYYKSPSWTPYRYGFDNPLRYIDPDGRTEKERKAALKKAEEYVTKNPNLNSEQYYLGDKGGPGTTVDCSGLFSNSVKASGLSDPNVGKKNGVMNIINNSSTSEVKLKEALPGMAIVFDQYDDDTKKKTKLATHIGIIESVKKDDKGNIKTITMIHSGFSTGPQKKTINLNIKNGFWANKFNGVYKWDTPDPVPATTQPTQELATSSSRIPTYEKVQKNIPKD